MFKHLNFCLNSSLSNCHEYQQHQANTAVQTKHHTSKQLCRLPETCFTLIVLEQIQMEKLLQCLRQHVGAVKIFKLKLPTASPPPAVCCSASLQFADRSLRKAEMLLHHQTWLPFPQDVTWGANCCHGGTSSRIKKKISRGLQNKCL